MYYCEKIWISYRRIFVSQSTTPQGKKSIEILPLLMGSFIQVHLQIELY